MATSLTREAIFGSAIADHLEVIRRLEEQQDLLEQVARKMTAALHQGNQILWCGNGGSAGDSQHLAAEIVGRFRRERRGLPSIALTTDTSSITAIANDYGFEAIFARQIEALGRPGDLLVGISTSGNSHNIIAAVEKANSLGITTVAFTGAGGGRLGSIADCLFAVDSNDTARVQEAHILAGHMLCDWIELDWIASHGHLTAQAIADEDEIKKANVR